MVLRGIHAKALVTLALWASGQVDDQAGKSALAIMKWMGAGKPVSSNRGPKEPVSEDEKDLGEFSKEQLERLSG